ncbi:type II toxin-antitoxin system YafQ family toxin [Bifidobacterium sp. ESL0790]|uniref:type II toxin-antitoxin system RelE/ParE family toxin n=1 Tax=Bifidobacterium sp. ESL0790 TaxID=2983233 RepID=UPI0023F95917|nr:type II toxin-antitoxin system YafQ family toxin [Bifidobacterium sp. ESL0790]WEV72510.1 type II toxin-antitoxin system YafQ family toxin [Bifidobacterium sp. ESL0790]
MLKSILLTPQFKRDYSSLLKKHYDKTIMQTGINALLQQNKDLLRTRYRDHALKGKWKGYREIHLDGDWLIIYRIEKTELQLVLTRTGSHDKLL